MYNMGMDNAQILSAITGRPVDDVRDDMARLDKSNRMGFDFLKELKKVSKNNEEFAGLVVAHIIMMLDDFKIEVKALMIMQIAKKSLSNELYEQDKIFNKFKENGKTKVTNTRRHRQDK